MVKSKQKQHRGNNKKSSKRATKNKLQKQLQHALSEANAQENPLATLPPAFLNVSLLPRSRGGGENDANGLSNANNDALGAQNKKIDAATVEYFSSQTMPPNILHQCLRLFKTNMGEMYEQSSWGLDLNEKLKELQHDDARFLVILRSDSVTANGGRATDAAPAKEANIDEANDGRDVESPDTDKDTPDISINNYGKSNVLGFTHYRYEPDDEERPKHPVTYLYELQISPTHQSLGLGKKLMTLVELLSLKTGMMKVMLTVFHCNEAAMAFYRKKKYVVDESSPSNFEGEESDNCDYEILSKSLGKDPMK